MSSYTALFTGKRITQMGLGLLGRGVGDASFLARNGAQLLVTDMKSSEELAESVGQLKQYENISYRLGGHFKEDFEECDLIIKGAGVPLDSAHIAHARQSGVPVDMSASLFARIARIPMLGVTGTRGKSTVTHLVYDMLKAEGRHAILGGNVKGVSNLALLETVERDSIGVFELDSWQCQGFGEERSLAHREVQQGPLSPHVAVFTTFLPDHLNYYKGDMDAYRKDKANIFLHQSASDTLIVGRQALPVLEVYRKEIRAHVIVADENDVPKTWKVPLLGVHNRYNVAVAIAVARAVGVDEACIRSTVEHAHALPGRLEFVRAVRNVRVYNDTNATTPDATATALEALDAGGEKRVVLIGGGADKTLNPERLAHAIETHAKACVLLKGSGTEKLLGLGNVQQYTLVESMEEAVTTAFALCSEGDVLVLSPGFASFGMFKNEYDRGEQFLACVEKLPE